MSNKESIVLGGGCFWCLEAVYQRVKGVSDVSNGYAGGDDKNPSYESVCSGTTGHAEVIKIEFDSDIVNLKTILKIFWVIHDPTTLNQQGADIGTQYRSVIFYETDEQKEAAKASLNKDAKSVWSKTIVTQILPLDTFYPAEKYHQNYFNNHPEAAYCQIVINPKVSKFKKTFSDYFVD